MIPISSSSRPAAAPALREAERTAKARPASRPASKAPLKPVKDEYVPEEKQASCGRYWLGKDEDGSPKIYFDDPEAAEAPAAPDAPRAEDGDGSPPAPEKSGEKVPEEERCVANTDKVDREIKRLREKREELEQRLSSETDEAKVRDLERKLAQVENELSQKDNDAYRRQHTKFTNG